MIISSILKKDVDTQELGISLKNKLEGVLALGISSGADFIEIFLENTNNISIMAEQDLITSVNPSFHNGAGIRVFLAERDGFVSTNDISTNGITKALTQALEMLGLEINKLSRKPFNGLSNYINVELRQIFEETTFTGN